MKVSRLSIRATLLIIISVLNVLIATLVGAGVYRSWENLEAIRGVARKSAAITWLYNTEKFLSIERGLAMAVINAPPATTAALQKDIMENRLSADEKLKAALDYIAAHDVWLSPEVKKVTESYAALQEARRKLDGAVTSHTNPEDALYDLSFDASTEAITDIESLIKAYFQSLLNVNASVSQHMFFKHFIWEITEYAGREYATIARLIAQNQAPSQETQDKLIVWKGRAEHDWEIAGQFAQTSGLGERMSPYIEEAKTHYFMTFDQIKDMFFAAGPDKITPPYPIDIQLWLEMSSLAVNSLMTLKDISLQETQNYIEKLEDAATRSIALNLTLFVCALTLSFYSWQIILLRVIKPVNDMVDSLYAQAHGEERALPSQVLSEQDEIGKLGLVLEVFQENARKIERASKDIQQQKNNLQAIIETALDAIVAIDDHGHITEWNPQAETMFGWARAEVMGKDMATIIMPHVHRAAHTAGMSKFLAGGPANILDKRIELEALNRQGAIFPVELSVTALKTDGRYNFTAFISDISARKQAEEERRHYMKSLEDSNRELDDFSYIASHDLKEPLRGLHNFSRFLLEDYSDKLEDEGKNMLQTIASLTKRMDELLSSLLHYSRLGRIDLSVRATDLDAVARDVIAMQAVRIKETGAQVTIAQKLPVVVCDHVRIAEVFQNLVANALKYNENPAPQIEIGYREDVAARPGEIVYYVRDNGIGIDKKNFESIFKIFRRLHAQDAYGGGTGSGLTIAKKIILRHGGEIWAESPGKGLGTTFFFTIPPQTPNPESAAA